ncbi:MAG: DNA polymerase III subunit [Chloroflexi bacterium]|nr:DNA polymerase III subunit [Chloroflexota bacterium]
MGHETWDLIGHEETVRFLQAQIQRGTVGHAYLFTGPSGVGRRTLALRFAQALACAHPPHAGAYCGHCRVCRLYPQQAHPDLHVLHDPGGLKVETVRTVRPKLLLSPRDARVRVVLLPNVEQATPAALNALLKSLEEPPEHVVFLLTARSPEAILPTLASRCQEFPLRPVPYATLRDGLTARGFPLAQAAWLAAWAQGRPGRALRWAQQPDDWRAYVAQIQDGLQLLHAPLRERLAYAAPYRAADREAVQARLATWQALWDLWLRLHQGLSDPRGHVAGGEIMRAVARQLTLNQVLQGLQHIQQGLRLLARYGNPRLVLEGALLTWPRLQGRAPDYARAVEQLIPAAAGHEPKPVP